MSVLIIGGGISGLACAWQLQQQGIPVTLLERSERFGGVIDRVQVDGFHFDVGPQSFSATPPLSKLIEELDLVGEVLLADARAPRYILLGGRLVRVPMGPANLFRTPLVGWRTKLRLLGEPFHRTRPPDGDESIAAFVRRKFGEDLLTNLVAPFVSGVYAGDPEKLSLVSAFPGVRQLEERFGSVIRGAIKLRRKGGRERTPLCNFKDGMTTLTAALAEKLGAAAICGASITAVRGGTSASTADAAGADPRFQITYDVHGVANSLDASAIVVATPTTEAGQLLSDIEPRFASTLGRIEYASVAQACTAYDMAQFRGTGAGLKTHSRDAAASNGPQGFGFLVPRTEHLRILGTVWNSALFPGQASGRFAGNAAADTVSFTSFLGGATDPDICLHHDEEIARIVHEELSVAMGISGPPAAVYVTRWMRALPQYNLGHAGILAELRELCAAAPGVFLAGNYLGGPSLGACIQQARTVAASVENFIGKPQ